MFKPNFTITPTILNEISNISEIKTIVERSKVLPLNEAQLRRQAIVRMAHTSTSIEGNKLAEFQVDKVLSGISINADEKSIKEVKNYQLGLKEVEKIADSKKKITSNLILEIHSILMKSLLPEDKVGHFRPGPIYIVDNIGDGREHLRYEGPPAHRVPYLINELLLWIYSSEAKNIHPIIKAALFHVHFVTIHPFSDGNGRIARLLTNLVLYLEDWDFRKIIVLEEFYNQNRSTYYNALNSVQGDHFHTGEDLTSWLEYFIHGFLVESKKVAESIQSIGFAQKDGQTKPVFLDKDEIKIMDFLTTTTRMTSSDIVDVLRVPKRTAQFKLKNLSEKGLIKMEGKGPSSYYVLT